MYKIECQSERRLSRQNMNDLENLDIDTLISISSQARKNIDVQILSRGRPPRRLFDNQVMGTDFSRFLLEEIIRTVHVRSNESLDLTRELIQWYMFEIFQCSNDKDKNAKALLDFLFIMPEQHKSDICIHQVFWKNSFFKDNLVELLVDDNEKMLEQGAVIEVLDQRVSRLGELACEGVSRSVNPRYAQQHVELYKRATRMLQDRLLEIKRMLLPPPAPLSPPVPRMCGARLKHCSKNVGSQLPIR